MAVQEPVPGPKLPYYDTNHLPSEEQGHTSAFHEATLNTSSVKDSKDDTLKAFALFIAHITESEEVAFAVDDASNAKSRHSAAIATIPDSDQPRSYSAGSVQLRIITDAEASTTQDDLDFEVRFLTQSQAPNSCRVS